MSIKFNYGADTGFIYFEMALQLSKEINKLYKGKRKDVECYYRRCASADKRRYDKTVGKVIGWIYAGHLVNDEGDCKIPVDAIKDTLCVIASTDHIGIIVSQLNWLMAQAD